jgi:hypothetical protein
VKRSSARSLRDIAVPSSYRACSISDSTSSGCSRCSGPWRHDRSATRGSRRIAVAGRGIGPTGSTDPDRRAAMAGRHA